MPRSYWLPHIALVGCLIALFGLGDLPERLLKAQSHEQNPKADSGESKAPRQNNITTHSSPGATSAGRPITTPTDQPACQDGSDCAQKDLVAQRRMASATDEIVTVSWLQFAVAVSGLVLGGLTVLFAFFAAKAARDAADSGRDTIEFMRKAERPYFIVKALNPKILDKPLREVREKGHSAGRKAIVVTATVANSGTRPGIPLSFHVAACHQPPPDPQPADIDTLGQLSATRTITSGEEADDVHGAFVWAAAFIKEAIEYRDQIVVYGYIRYSDIHGTTWRSGFSFELQIPDIDSGESVYFVQSGPASHWYDKKEADQPEQT